MAVDVFICHCTEDKPTADAICAFLERGGHRCWIAPRDILPGKSWGEAIIDAIANCQVMVVVFSSHCNSSAQVMREVERAVNRGIPIIPFRIEDVCPSGSLEYYLSTPHWLDALTPPLEDHIDRLATTISSLLRAEGKSDQRPLPSVSVRREAVRSGQHDERPRVQLTYEVESFGKTRRVELPFVTGVLADLSGANAGKVTPRVADRHFVDIDDDNFNAVLKRSAPRVTFAAPSFLGQHEQLNVDLSFESLNDFSPMEVAKRIPHLAELIDARGKLLQLHLLLDSDTSAQRAVSTLIADKHLRCEVVANADRECNEHSRACLVDVLGTDASPASMTDPIVCFAKHLADSQCSPTSSPRRVVEAVIRHLDSQLSQQVNAIIHHGDFQRLHSTWLGLHYLVEHTDTNCHLKIRVLNITKRELHKDLDHAPEFDQSALFKKIYEEEYGAYSGEPFGLLVGDYYFDNTPDDVHMLAHVSGVAAAAHVPFIAAASPQLFNIDSWHHLNRIRDLEKVFDVAHFAKWHDLRRSEDSLFVALTVPRFLARLPFHRRPGSAEDFHFAEDIDAETLTWGNSAFVLAANIHRSFAKSGWCSQICGVETGGHAEGMLSCSFETIHGHPEVAGPAEVFISDRRENELVKLGFISLINERHGSHAVFVNVRSLRKPMRHVDDEPIVAEYANDLRYLLAGCRFAQYLKCIVRDRAKSFHTAEELRRFLSEWICEYVLPNPEEYPPEYRIKRPLSSASVEVEEDVGRGPGEYRCELAITPHIDFGRSTMPLRTTFRIWS